MDKWFDNDFDKDFNDDFDTSLFNVFLFFIFGQISGGRVTVTDGDCRLYYTIMNKLLHDCYISNGKSNPPVVFLHQLF